MQFKDNSRQAKKAVKDAGIEWLTKSSLLVVGQAQALAAHDTGYLRDVSIDYEVDEAEMRAYVGSSADYAVFIEFGTGEFAENGGGRKGGWVYRSDKDGKWYFTYGQPPKPFLRPAFRNNKSRIEALGNAIFSKLGG